MQRYRLKLLMVMLFVLQIIARFMDMRKAAAAPQMSLGFVDVRDVARAHIIAMTNDRSDGHRILITNQPSIWFADILKIIRKEFRMQGIHLIYCIYL